MQDENRTIHYMDLQTDINSKMRAILIDWLVEVHRKLELMPETLYLTINIIDRYLSTKIVSRSELQLVGITSMLIACKYEEIWAPEVVFFPSGVVSCHHLLKAPTASLIWVFGIHFQVNDFVCISDNAYDREQILQMEKSILTKLEWYLTVPTPYVFLVRYIKASVAPDQEVQLSLKFWKISSEEIIIMVFFPRSIVDGRDGVFPNWTGSDELFYNIVLPIGACCFSSICGSLHPPQDPSLECNSKALHGLHSRPTDVILI